MSYGLTLSLDGSTYAGSVALIRDTEVIAQRELEETGKPGRAGREELFMPMVAKCLRDGKVAVGDLQRVVCGAGPGSFTSLRVAASIAKGIAVGTSIPLFSVPSLALIVAAANETEGRWLAALPAMRGEVYVSLYEWNDGVLREIQGPGIIAEAALDKEAAASGARIVGHANENQNSALRVPRNPHARGVALMMSTILDRGPVDIDTWEPQYGRLAEAQVKWEAAHGRPLPASV
jgi:tRNA threonylcarbamoyladenosine biosynthesis protein TsaB